jgi:hypothetical protein
MPQVKYTTDFQGKTLVTWTEWRQVWNASTPEEVFADLDAVLWLMQQGYLPEDSTQRLGIDDIVYYRTFLISPQDFDYILLKYNYDYLKVDLPKDYFHE